MIKGVGISKFYGDLHVLKGIDIEVGFGEIVSIVGPSGAGKTTLLQILSSLDTGDAGEVFLDNTSINLLNDKILARFRNENIGFVFQFHQLLPEFTALENVIIPALIRGESKSVATKRALELLDFLNVSHRTTHKPNEMSGGEKQRVAVARALINNPKVVFADEPTGNLDSANQLELQRLFQKLRDTYNVTFVIVTHDMELARMSDRVIKMRDGLIEP